MSFRTGLLRVTSLSSRRAIVSNTLYSQILSRSESHDAVLTHDADKKRSRLHSYVETLKTASQRSEVEVINQYYPALAWEASQLAITSSPESSHAISEDQIESILETLAASGRPVDLNRINQILADMSDIFGTPPTADTHTAIIHGLIRRQNAQTVMRWFENMQEKPGGIRPTLEHYHLLLEASPEFTSFKNMRGIVQTMYETGCLPDTETYKILIQGLWKLSSQPPPPSHIIPILQEMRDKGLPYDLAIYNFLTNAYHTRGLTRWANEIQSHYNQTFASDSSPSQITENIWTPRFSQTVSKEGLSAGLALYPEFLEAGGKPSFRIFNALLRHSCTVDDMNQISKVLGKEATQVQWAMMIAEQTQRGFLDTGLHLYERARSVGISPSAPMVGVLIRALFKHNSVPYTDKVVDKALELYDDLKLAVSEDNPVSTDCRVKEDGPDLDIYTRLLHGLSLAENSMRYSPAVSILLEDVKVRGMKLHTMTASIAVMRIRLAGGEEEAFREYQKRRNTLNQTGYERVLDAFCRLSVQGGVKIPSLSRYFNIVKDMRQAGYEVTPQIYTILLRHMGKLGTRTKHDPGYISLMPRLISATRRIHDLITLDATITPEPYLWNQMMDTYQRLNCFGDAYRVWDQMFISKKFDHVSVSIIFDACGYAKGTHLLQQIMTRLKREHFELNLHNWNTYIECLCRLEKLNAAVKALCLEMTGNVLPTAETVRIVRSFAKRSGLDDEIMRRIQQYQPELHRSLEMEKKKEKSS